MVINHEHYKYKQKQKKIGKGRFNGAYYYSKEICQNIIPRVRTQRHWITINIPNVGCDYSIVFIHNNLSAENYEWLSQFKDLVLVCGVPETCNKVAHLGKAIYLPLSVDVEYVRQFAREKTKDTAFVGRAAKMKYGKLPNNIDYLCGMQREELLKRMAEYKRVYAVGRVAIEAKILGCEVLPYDDRFPDTDFWQVLDNSEAAIILQRLLDEIDRKDV